jgi:methionyl aminopeptidase
MSIESSEDLAGMMQAGKVTRAVLDGMKAVVQPGISTRELDEVGASIMRNFGGRSAPMLAYGFPGHNCISVNEEVVHGVPGARKLAEGDLVKLDVTVEVDGYMADACETVAVGSVDHESKQLMDCASRAFWAGLSVVRPRCPPFRHRKRSSQDCERSRLLRCARSLWTWNRSNHS